MAADTASSSVFTISGARETVSAERAHQLVQPLLDAVKQNQPSRYHTIKLSNKSFTPASAQIVADALAQLTDIHTADFADIIAGQPTQDATDVLRILTTPLSKQKLVEFNISDNALGKRGVVAISTALQYQPLLEHLYFNNNGLESDAVEAMAEALLGDKSNSKSVVLDKLHTFEIFNNLLNDAGAIALAVIIKAAPNLHRLRIQTNRISSAGGDALMRALQKHRKLQHLILADNSFSSDEAGKIGVQVVRANKHLKNLTYSDIGFDRRYILATLKLLAKPHVCPQLQELHLTFSELTSRSIPLLVDCLKHKHHLTHISLEGNELKSKGVTQLLSAVEHHPAIHTINLNETSIGGSATVDALNQLLTKSTRIQHLSLSGNYLDEDSVNNLAVAAEKAGNTTLTLVSDDLEDADDYEDGDDDDSDAESVAELSSSDEEHVDDQDENKALDQQIDQLATKLDKNL